MRCPRCGDENPATHRFCGMCGTSLLQATASATAGPTAKPAATAPAAGNVNIAPPPPPVIGNVTIAPPPLAPAASAAPPAVPSAAPAQHAATEEAPIISGPSFLGLNQRAPARPRKVTLSIDPHGQPSSRDLDYLLEDDEEPKRGSGAWKLFLVVIALALAVGFAYLRWRNQGLPSLGAGADKPSAAAENSASPDAGAPTSSASPAAAPGQPAASLPGANTATTPAVAPAAAPPASANSSAANSSPANPAAASPAATSTAGSAQPNPAPGAGGNGNGSAGSVAQPAAASGAATPNSAPPATVVPKPAPAEPLAKPPAAVAPAPDQIARAQRYIYGKGVPQDCDRGLRILKPVVDRGDPKAMIEMGALYSAGLCTPRDLPTAYRWFALALRKDPNNLSLQADLEKLWGEMTQPERQLAIKLSQ